MAAQESEPRVRVAAVVLVDDEIILVRQTKGGRDYYLLPGGGVERGETLEEALVREVAEETGIVIRVVRPLFINDTLAPDGSRHLVNLTFLCDAVEAVAADTTETAVVAVERAGREHLACLDLRPPLAPPLIEAWAGGFTGPCRYLGTLWVDGP